MNPGRDRTIITRKAFFKVVFATLFLLALPGNPARADCTNCSTGSTVGGDVVHTFTSGSGTFTAPAGVTQVEYLVVGGGGGGGGIPAGGNPGGAGGGGAGGYATGTLSASPGSPVTVTVGDGGAGGVGDVSQGGNGQGSSFGSITAGGGGGGASWTSGGSVGVDGENGASGGGGRFSGTGGSGTAQGNPGGDGDLGGGGGGGAGSAGANGIGAPSTFDGYGGGGGGGVANNITGASMTYAAGGNGGDYGIAGPRASGSAGTANTGNGGGGASGSNGGGAFDGAAGGSGIVVIRYTPVPLPGEIGGSVFRDYNADGALDAAEPGVPGITVTAYDNGGTAAATTATDADGNYTLTGLTDGVEYRIELTNVPDYLRPGPVGASSQTTVAFASSPDIDVQVGLHNPGQHVRDGNYDLATSRHLQHWQSQYGGPVNESNAVLLGFPSDSGCQNYDMDLDCDGAPQDFRDPDPTYIANGAALGPTWGLAYHRESDSLFAASYMKRHVGFQSNGNTGVIWRIQNPMSGSPTVSEYVNFDDLSIDTGNDPHPNNQNQPDWELDPGSWDAVGKVGFGDMDISDDGSTLWVVNLFDRMLYSLPVLSTGAPSATSHDIAAQIDTGGPNQCPAESDLRPFGLSFHDGSVYVGVVCSAESTTSGGSFGAVTGPVGDRSELRAYVLQFDPSSTTWTVALEFPLDYPRGNSIGSGTVTVPAAWNPWVPEFTIWDRGPSTEQTSYPQPMLSDIEFDGGDMILGLRDRFGDQTGYSEHPPGNDGDDLTGSSPGDILRACNGGSGTWIIEHDGSCNGSGEHYNEDDYLGIHDEAAFGALAQSATDNRVASTAHDVVRDPEIAFNGGVYWLDNGGGSRNQAYVLYESESGLSLDAKYGTGDPVNPGTFAKANGLGDLEILVPPAPIELGNRVWDDYDGDGIQDPGEPGLSGAVVGLYDGAGELIDTVTTDGDGNFLFSNDSRASDSPGRNYDVPIDSSGDYTLAILDSNFDGGGPLEVYSPTPTTNQAGTSNDAVTDNNDSDGVDVAVGSGGDSAALGVGFTNQGSGANNHGFDFGFVQYDLGDAPDSYGTTLATGARHLISRDVNGVPLLQLGGVPDSERDGQPGPGADNDTEEDGVTFRSPSGQSIVADVAVSNGTGGEVTVCAWLDVPSGGSVDGVFQPGDGMCQTTSAGGELLTFQWSNLPNDGAYTTYARFRVSSDSLAPSSATGTATNGEIEDYRVQFDFTPTAATIGKVRLEAAPVDGFLAGLGADEMTPDALSGLLESWDPGAASVTNGADRSAVLDALTQYADPDGDGRVAVFRWDTLAERGTIGFHVERREGSGDWVGINGDLLPGLINAPMGAEYRLVDPDAHSGRVYEYRLIELEATGNTRTYGPYSVEMP